MKICTVCNYTTDVEYGDESLRTHTNKHILKEECQHRAIWQEISNPIWVVDESCGGESENIYLFSTKEKAENFKEKVSKNDEISNYNIHCLDVDSGKGISN